MCIYKFRSMYLYMYMYRYAYVYIYIRRYMSQRGVVAAHAPMALFLPLVTASCYTPPVADLRFSNKPCLKVAKVRSLVAQAHMKSNLYRCQWSCWLAEAILLRKIGGGM